MIASCRISSGSSSGASNTSGQSNDMATDGVSLGCRGAGSSRLAASSATLFEIHRDGCQSSQAPFQSLNLVISTAFPARSARSSDPRTVLIMSCKVSGMFPTIVILSSFIGVKHLLRFRRRPWAVVSIHWCTRAESRYCS